MRSSLFRDEGGNVIFIILITIILFAALSFTVGNMLQSGAQTGTITKEKARLMAGEIIDYSRTLRQTIKDLQISEGCTDSEISFENSETTNYTFATRDECKVFGADGGRAKFNANGPNGNTWLFNERTAIFNVGTDNSPNVVCSTSACTELAAFLVIDSDTLCDQINNQLNLAEDIAGGTFPNYISGTGASDYFLGSYTYGQAIGTATVAPQTNGMQVACIDSSSSSVPSVFYQVLIAR